MLILAHRGASADRPENTVSAFAEAVAQGADGVELDVMRCRSGEVVVCHDEQLSRLAGVDWEVARTPFWKLAQARIFGTERIPLLEEVLQLLPPHFLINVELKCDDVDDRGLSVATGELLTRMGLEAQVVISSFNPLCLVRLARAYPRFRRGYLLDPERSHLWHAHLVSPWVANYSIHPHHRACTPRRVSLWHEAGLKVATWTVDEPAEAETLRAMGVDVLITNRPGRLRTALG